MTPIDMHIQNLKKTNRLETYEEQEIFSNALKALSQSHLSPDQITSLYSVFDDDTRDEYQTMFGLIHLIESLTANDHRLGIKLLLDAEGQIKNPEGEWFEIIIGRIINHDAASHELARQLNSKKHTATHSMVEKISKDADPYLAPNAFRVLDRLQK